MYQFKIVPRKGSKGVYKQRKFISVCASAQCDLSFPYYGPLANPYCEEKTVNTWLSLKLHNSHLVVGGSCSLCAGNFMKMKWVVWVFPIAAPFV